MDSVSTSLTYRIRRLPTNDRTEAKFLLRRVLQLERSQRLRIGSLARDLERDSIYVATIHFDGPSSSLPSHNHKGKELDEWAVAIQDSEDLEDSNDDEPSITVDTHFRDFTPLNSAEEDGPGWDLIAVSGLGGHAFGSWKQRDGTYMWLRDGVVQENTLKGVRVVLYGYDSRTLQSESFQDLGAIASTFKNRLKGMRRKTSRTKRPLILLGHSLGGLVLKQALIQLADRAKEGDEREKAILHSIFALLFFGVPSGGMAIESLMGMVQGRPNAALVAMLDRNSASLVSQHQSFCDAFPFQDSKVHSFYETQRSPTAVQTNGRWTMTGPMEILVDRASATQSRGSWESGSYYFQPIDRSHSEIVKFGRDDEYYQLVKDRLDDISESIIDTIDARFRTNHDNERYASPHASTDIPPHSTRLSNVYDNEIMASLSFPEMLDRRANIQAPHRQTCKWILELQEYQDWRSQTSGLLWIKGYPGAGKSTMMAFLYKAFSSERQYGSGINMDFFFNARGSQLQHTPLGMLRSLLHQLFRQDPASCDVARRPYLEKRAIFGSGERPWEWQQQELEVVLAEAVLTCAKGRQVTLFIDALDEAGENAAREMAHYFHSLNDRVLDNSTTLKICLSCRHYPVPSRVPGMEVKLEEHNHDDIVTFIYDRLSLQRRTRQESGGFGADSGFNSNPDTWRVLANDLIKRANGVFQWVCLVLPMIEKCIDDGESLKSVQRRLREVPEQLENVYKHIIQNVIDRRHRIKSFILFQWVCLAERPLTVTEMRFAIAAKDARASPPQIQSCDTPDFVSSDEAMIRQIRAWSGGLIEVVGSTKQDEAIVQVIHQSVNDFLFSQGLGMLEQKNGSSTMSLDCPASGDAPEVIRRCQGTLYRCCLTCFATTCYPFVTGSMYDDRQRVAASSPLVPYATVWMFYHAERAGHQRYENLEEEVEVIYRIKLSWKICCAVFNSNYLDHIIPCLGSTVLHIAAYHNLSDLVQHLVQAECNVNTWDKEGYTAIHLAASRGHVNMVRLLYVAGARLDTETLYGDTPLVLAADQGRLGVVEWFITYDSRPEYLMSQYALALCAAASAGHTAVVQLLISAGAGLNAIGGRFGSALQAASGRGHKEIVQLLLEAGADVNVQGGGGFGSALQAASSHNCIETVRLLLRAGADVNAPAGEYKSALQLALDHQEIVQLLLDAGAVWRWGG